MKEFTPEVGRYDVIWIQWCIGQLPDDDFLLFFKRAKVINCLKWLYSFYAFGLVFFNLAV